jgi:hypothetical protein
MLSIWNQLIRPATARQISNWSVEVARRCQTEVASRLSSSIHRMSLPEARGYIRARSARFIKAEIPELSLRTDSQAAGPDAIRERAIEETIRLAIGDLLRATRRAIPTPQPMAPARRKAA